MTRDGLCVLFVQDAADSPPQVAERRLPLPDLELRRLRAVIEQVVQVGFGVAPHLQARLEMPMKSLAFCSTAAGNGSLIWPLQSIIDGPALRPAGGAAGWPQEGARLQRRAGVGAKGVGCCCYIETPGSPSALPTTGSSPDSTWKASRLVSRFWSSGSTPAPGSGLGCWRWPISYSGPRKLDHQLNEGGVPAPTGSGAVGAQVAIVAGDRDGGGVAALVTAVGGDPALLEACHGRRPPRIQYNVLDYQQYVLVSMALPIAGPILRRGATQYVQFLEEYEEEKREKTQKIKELHL